MEELLGIDLSDLDDIVDVRLGLQAAESSSAGSPTDRRAAGLAQARRVPGRPARVCTRPAFSRKE